MLKTLDLNSGVTLKFYVYVKCTNTKADNINLKKKISIFILIQLSLYAF